MMNKILVKVMVPTIEGNFEVWVPLNEKASNVIELLIKGVKELSSGIYKPTANPILYNKVTGQPFDTKKTVKENGMQNASEVILV